ncbi:MAG: rhodanese-like domain-containing protein [Flavobacteriia bacterium]|nr:rhodanese-like domain-containing protein [Flavobacteriia bacterium]
MKKNICLIFCLLMGLIATAQFRSKPMSKTVLNKAKKFVVVDVRTAEEFKSGHISGAENIDWFSPNFNTAFQDLKKRQKIYVYCRSGKRSTQAAARLDSLGFKRVVNLLGGYNAFKDLE